MTNKQFSLKALYNVLEIREEDPSSTGFIKLFILDSLGFKVQVPPYIDIPNYEDIPSFIQGSLKVHGILKHFTIAVYNKPLEDSNI